RAHDQPDRLEAGLTHQQELVDGEVAGEEPGAALPTAHLLHALECRLGQMAGWITPIASRTWHVVTVLACLAEGGRPAAGGGNIMTIVIKKSRRRVEGGPPAQTYCSRRGWQMPVTRR